MTARSDIQDAANDVADVIDDTREALKRTARSDSSVLDDVHDNFNDMIDEYSESLKKWARVVSDQTRQTPLLALGAAFAAGIVISKLTRR